MPLEVGMNHNPESAATPMATSKNIHQAVSGKITNASYM